MTLPDSTPRSVVLIDDNLLFSAGVEATLRRLGFQVRTLPGGPGTEMAETLCAELRSAL